LKITWNATSKTVIYRSKRHHNTKRNFRHPDPGGKRFGAFVNLAG
jgi:hypothetical protein